MSRIGNRLINIPAGVTVDIKSDNVVVKGPKGELTIPYNNKCIIVENKDNIISVKRTNEIKTTKMLHGTTNAHIKNAIVGVTETFVKTLIFKGVGYKAKTEGSKLNLTLGFSHPVILDIPSNIKIDVVSPTEINVSSISKTDVGEFCAVVRAYRKPEPYKGKGILFKGEQIIRKAGKTADK